MTQPIFELPRLDHLLAQVSMLSTNITPQGALMTIYAGLDVPSLFFQSYPTSPSYTDHCLSSYSYLGDELIDVCLFHLRICLPG